MYARLLLLAGFGFRGLEGVAGDEGLARFVWMDLARFFAVGFNNVVLCSGGLHAY